MDGLDLEEVVEFRHLLKLLVGASRDDAADEFARLARRADDDPLAVLRKHSARHAWPSALFRAAKVADVREGDEAVEVIQSRLVLCEKDDVMGTLILGLVEKVALHAVDDLDILPLFLEGARRVHRLGECLHNAVVGDGDGRPAPAGGGLNEYLRRDDGIERTHLCMGVQFDALHLCRVLALRHRAPLHRVDEEDVVADEFVVLDFPLYADGAALADCLEDALHLGVDVLLCGLAARGKEFLARDAVCLVGKFEQEDVCARLELVRLRRKDFPLKDDVFDFVLNDAELTRLAGDAAPEDDVCRQFLGLCPLGSACRSGGCRGFLFDRHGQYGRRPLRCSQIVAEVARHAHDACGTADLRADSRLDPLCYGALRKQLRAECARRREADHVAFDLIRGLPQGVEEDGILSRRLAYNALPQGGNGALQRDDVLLHECAREGVVRLDLTSNRRQQLLIEDGGRSDDQFPCIFLCRDLDMTQGARTQKRPLLIGEGESAQQAQEHILRTWKNPIGLVHSS